MSDRVTTETWRERTDRQSAEARAFRGRGSKLARRLLLELLRLEEGERPLSAVAP